MAKNAKQFEERPWGSFEVIAEFEVENDLGPHAVVKKITVNPKQRLSYQSHKGRREFWLIVQGKGQVVLGGKEIAVSAGSRVEVPQGAKHRVVNTDANQALLFVEVSLGSFDENDILRYDDDYGRTNA
ncbi:MAG: phosphomannose isomerase type II C-terminal cupin domain [Candidatus Doudnabacteria bacterium]|nr:phosphomannose isomerase type II C-terminal cupin domain [Candidatus Doudnabacteria bacterium]